jgi:hypothetical protein
MLVRPECHWRCARDVTELNRPAIPEPLRRKPSAKAISSTATTLRSRAANVGCDHGTIEKQQA